MRHRGFTLMEVMASLAVLVLLAAAIYSMLGDLGRARERLATEIGEQDIASILFERVESGLAITTAGDGVRAGIQGEHDRLSLQARAVTPPITMRGGATSVAAGDLQAMEIRFDSLAGTVSGARWDALNDAPRPPLETWASGVERLRFRYLVGRTWQSSFNSQEAGGLPAAIEVAIWLGEPAVNPDAIQLEAEPGFVPGDLADLDSRSAGRALPAQQPGPVADEQLVQAPTRAPERRRVVVILDGPEVLEASEGGAA